MQTKKLFLASWVSFIAGVNFLGFLILLTVHGNILLSLAPLVLAIYLQFFAINMIKCQVSIEKLCFPKVVTLQSAENEHWNGFFRSPV